MSWRRQVEQYEVQEPDRLLEAARSAGWLSYQADPERKVLVMCGDQHWMAGRSEEFREESHRHPSAWWEMRYKWIDEADEPRKPEYKICGRNVGGLEYMSDASPEQAPCEKTRLNCLGGTKQVTLPCIQLRPEDLTCPEVAENMKADAFEKHRPSCLRMRE